MPRGSRCPVIGLRIRNSVRVGVPQVIDIPRIARKEIRCNAMAIRSVDAERVVVLVS